MEVARHRAADADPRVDVGLGGAQPAARLEVGIGHVAAAGLRDVAIHHDELAVVADVAALEEEAQDGCGQRLDHAHPGCLEGATEPGLQECARPDAVHQEPHLHAALGRSHQGVGHGMARGIVLEDVEEEVRAPCGGVDVLHHPAQLFRGIARELHAVAAERQRAAGGLAEVRHLRIGRAHRGAEHPGVLPVRVRRASCTDDPCMAPPADGTDAVLPDDQVEQGPDHRKGQQRGNPRERRIRPGSLDPHDSNAEQDADHEGHRDEDAEHVGHSFEAQHVAQEFVDQPVHASCPPGAPSGPGSPAGPESPAVPESPDGPVARWRGRRRNQSQMATISNRFSPFGRSARTVSPTRAFMRATPRGLDEVTSM